MSFVFGRPPAGGRRGLRVRAPLVLALLISALMAPAVWAADGGTIESVEVRGLKRMTKDAFVFASGLRAGQPYSEAAVRDAFRRLWERGLFSDLRADAEQGRTGTIVIFTVTERPVIVSLEYDEVRAITRTNIDDRFKERGVDLAIGRPVDRRLIARARETIRDLLGEKGYLDATVTAEITPVSDQSSAVRFRIRQGARTRIHDIDFIGNTVFSDHKLKSAMKLTREHSIFTSINGKDIYFPAKYDQDIEKVRELYQNLGYLDVEIRPAQLEIRESGVKEGETPSDTVVSPPVELPPAPEPAPIPDDETGKEREKRLKEEEKAHKKANKEAEKAEGKRRKWVYLTVRVAEGTQYRLGEITTTGNTVFADDQVIRSIPIQSGWVLNRAMLDAGIENLRIAYGDRGYIYASIGRSVQKREGNIADVKIDIREDRPYIVDRIEFQGNVTTRDEVLRREMRLSEGGLISKRKLDLSVFKLNQLGFIGPTEDPILEPIPGTDRVRVLVRTEEKGRNEIQVGGGYSGTAGFFFAGSYSTRNFLGRGEILGVSMQVGGSSNRYTLSFTEPYFLGKPITAGFSIFRRDVDFAQNANQSGRGLSLILGRRLGDFTLLQGVYSFETVNFTEAQPAFDSQGSQNQAHTRVGSLTPIFSYDRINNPFRPTAGMAFSVSSQIAGRYLGGDNSYTKPLIRGTKYLPLTKKTYFGVHAEFGGLALIGNALVESGNVLGIPRFERYYLGGDQVGPRVFETRTLSPIRFISVDGTRIEADRDKLVRYKGRDIFGRKIEVFCDERFDFTPGDSRCTGGLRPLLVGADRYGLGQFEYAFSAGGPFVLAAFVDVAMFGAEDTGWDPNELRASVGLEARIFLPVFQAPLRFIFGRSIQDREFDTTNNFQFSIGQSF